MYCCLSYGDGKVYNGLRKELILFFFVRNVLLWKEVTEFFLRQKTGSQVISYHFLGLYNVKNIRKSRKKERGYSGNEEISQKDKEVGEEWIAFRNGGWKAIQRIYCCTHWLEFAVLYKQAQEPVLEHRD